MRTTLILLMIMSSMHISRAQTLDEWIRQKKTQKKYLVQQVAALKVYLDYLKKGYKIVDKGLTMVGNIKEGKFDLDIEYLMSLKNVNNVIHSSSKVAGAVTYQRRIMSEFQRLKKISLNTEMLTYEEKHYVEIVYSNLLLQSENFLNELDEVLRNEEFEMKDDERLKRVDALYLNMRDMYVFTKSFSSSTELLIAQRSKESMELMVEEKLNSN